jgi:hypothetical protein
VGTAKDGNDGRLERRKAGTKEGRNDRRREQRNEGTIRMILPWPYSKTWFPNFQSPISAYAEMLKKWKSKAFSPFNTLSPRASGPPIVVGPLVRMAIIAPLKVGPPARMAGVAGYGFGLGAAAPS